MTCLECQDLLQRRLDGAAPVLSEAWKEHLAQCATCRAAHAAGQALLKGLGAISPPAVPLDFSQRMLGLVLADRQLRRRRVRLRFMVTAALAASLLVMTLAGYLVLPIPRHAPALPDPVAKEKQQTPAPGTAVEGVESFRLAESVAGARQAVASLSDRWANQAREQTQNILAGANPIAIPDMENLPGMADPLEPAAQSFQQAGQGLADGLQPVAASARRALAYLFRDLPILEGTAREP